MVLALLAASLLPPQAGLHFDLRLTGTEVKPGKPITATLTVTNRGTRPCVIAKPIGDGAPAASAYDRLMRGREELVPVGPRLEPRVQVVVSDYVTKDRFLVLPPLGSVDVYWVTYEGELDFGGAKSRDKAAYAKAKPIPLRPGTYDCTIAYDFNRERILSESMTGLRRDLKFDSGAKDLWDSAIETSVRLTKRFKVVRE